MAIHALILDVDPNARTAIQQSLASFGLTFIACEDPDEALVLARTVVPNIIFVRVESPTVSGFSTCNKLRKDDKTKKIPLVLYASDVAEDVFGQHGKLKTRADEYVRIPAGADTWRGVVKKLLPTS
jgi:CheY-like chemotaxis protein